MLSDDMDFPDLPSIDHEGKGNKEGVPAKAERSSAIPDRHRQIIRLIAQGYSNTEIAEMINCSPPTVTKVRHDPMARAHIEYLQKNMDAAAMNAAEVEASVKQLAGKASRYLEDIMDDPFTDPDLKFKAAKDILDRAGHSGIQKTASVTMSMDSSELQQIKDRAKEIKPQMIDIETLEKDGTENG